MNLREELDKFWDWAGVNIDEYALGINPKKELPVEWESHYPNWDRLQKSFWLEINEYKNDFMQKRENNILEFLGIDNESGLALDVLIEEMDEKEQDRLIKAGCQFKMPQTRWQIAEFLKESNVSNGRELLAKMIIKDEDKYVQRRALLSLSYIDPDLAKKYAYLKIQDEDEYLRLVSLRLLKELKSEKLQAAITILQDDSSPLIKEELTKPN